MSFLEALETPRPNPSALFIGAASPLWTYFGAAVAGGVAFWWMTRWPQNLEAMFAAATRTADAASETVAEAVAAAVPEAAVEALAAPVGGEAAPVSALAAFSEPEPAPEPQAAEPAAAAAPEPVVEPEPRSVRPPRPRRPDAPLDA